jgi:hypothetical protein
MPRRLLALLAATLLGSGCKSEFPNPFENFHATATPPPQATLLFTSNRHAGSAGAPRDVFAIADDGSDPTRLTSCNSGNDACDAVEAVISSDRTRLAVRRVSGDTNHDGRLSEADAAALVLVDLAHSVEATLVPASAGVMGVDWSPRGEVLVYSANGSGGIEDLYRTDSNGQNGGALTRTAAERERHPRIDPTGSAALYEHVDAGGASEIWIFQSATSQTRVVPALGAGAALPGTPYRVGAAADPAYSPDGRSLVFRRLTGIGDGSLGDWEIVTFDGISFVTIAAGPAYRGAPDWGTRGIVYPETDPTSGATSLVVVQPDGASRRAILSVGPGFTLSAPRWLP